MIYTNKYCTCSRQAGKKQANKREGELYSNGLFVESSHTQKIVLGRIRCFVVMVGC